jgi:hypothetical protein
MLFQYNSFYTETSEELVLSLIGLCDNTSDIMKYPKLYTNYIHIYFNTCSSRKAYITYLVLTGRNMGYLKVQKFVQKIVLSQRSKRRR